MLPGLDLVISMVLGVRPARGRGALKCGFRPARALCSQR